MRASVRSLGRKCGTPSFTLPEVLVAIAILSFLVLILAKILAATEQAWVAAQSGEDSFREGRAALYVVLHDLESAQISSNTPMTINNSALYPGTGGATTNIYFMVPMPADAQGVTGTTGDLCEVGYYTAYTVDDNSPNQTKSYKLYRFFRPSGPAFTNLESAPPPPFTDSALSTLFRGAGPIAPNTESPAGTPDPVTSDSAQIDEVLAHNVSNLQISWTTNVPTSSSTPNSGFATTPYIFNTNAPVAVSISLDSLSSAGAQRLTTIAAWQDTTGRLYTNYAHSFYGQAAIPPSQ